MIDVKKFTNNLKNIAQMNRNDIYINKEIST